MHNRAAPHPATFPRLEGCFLSMGKAVTVNTGSSNEHSQDVLVRRETINGLLP